MIEADPPQVRHEGVRHRHGQHTWHGHTAVEYATHQEMDGDDEEFPNHAPDCGAISTDFFEEDEPLEDVMEAWKKGERRQTRAPLRPGITVLVGSHPARYTSSLLTRALASVVAQTHQPEVIVVVNDKERQGAGWTRQTLLHHVETEWIAWIDSDDEWLPEHLEKLYEVAVVTNAVYVYSWFHGNDPLGHFGLPFNPCTPHHTTMTSLVRTDIAQEVGFPDSEKPPFSNEDWAFITGVSKLACERGLNMVHLAERTWTYHQHGQNSSGLPGQGDAT